MFNVTHTSIDTNRLWFCIILSSTKLELVRYPLWITISEYTHIHTNIINEKILIRPLSFHDQTSEKKYLEKIEYVVENKDSNVGYFISKIQHSKGYAKFVDIFNSCSHFFDP